MQRVLIFGTGSGAQKALKTIDENYKVVGFVDNNSEKHHTQFMGQIVYSPTEIFQLSWDVIVVCSVAYKTIRKQLIELGVVSEKIKNKNYFHLQKFLDKYETEEYSGNYEVQEVIQYVKKNGLDIFNYDFCKLYEEDVLPINVEFDSECGLYYVIYSGKKMYISRMYKTEKEVADYVRGIMKEQDSQSPHCYLTDDYKLKKGSVIVDAGVAEGNFSLENIDEAKHIYMIESDDMWIEALEHTFAPYSDKVTIIKDYLCDHDGEGYCSLDNLLGEKKIDFIKMDIEGAEVSALLGAIKILKNQAPMLDICAYHNEDDEGKIVTILKECGYSTECSKGYMVFLVGDSFQTTKVRSLVRGLVRGWKEKI